MWKWLLALLIAFGAYQHFHHRPIHRTPGMVAPDEPVQTESGLPAELHKAGYTIAPLATFDITARVLSDEHYSFGRESDLSPVDLALGWGAMSDSAVLNKITISQSGRFYYWQVDDFPIPREEIETHSANMHMIPATREVQDTLEKIRPGQVVTIHGYLIEAKASDGWHWRSSLTRNDTGGGACEVVWVESISAS